MFALDFSNDVSHHKRAAHLDFVHHLMGNGSIQAVIQVTETRTCRNALVLHLMDPDVFRPKSGSFTFHQVLGPELTGLSLSYKGHLYFPHPRQTAFDLQYRLLFEDGAPVFRASYPADYTIEGERKKTPFNVEESIFCANDHAAVIRKARITNRRGLDGEESRLFSFLVPNQNLFPDAHYVTSSEAAIAGRHGDGGGFLGMAAIGAIDGHNVAEFPVPFEAAAKGRLDALGASCDDGVLVRPRGSTMDWLLSPGHAYLGPVLSLQFDLGVLEPRESKEITLAYAYGDSESEVLQVIGELRTMGAAYLRKEAVQYWQGCNIIQTGDRRLDDFFAAAKAGVRASVAASGRMDSTLWGYNNEWVHDSSLQSIGATLSGQHALARAMLDHLLSDLVDSRGMCFDITQYGETRRAVLDQNGWLLFALWLYWVHSRDVTIIRRHWEKIRAVAEFPLRSQFWVEEASMVKSGRDWKERDCEAFGIGVGYELVFQMWVSIGLAKASDMAGAMGNRKLSQRWGELGARIWSAALTHPKFKLIDNGHFMKRRSLEGELDVFVEGVPYFALPMRVGDTSDVRMFPRRRHGPLEPDPGEAWPIARGLVDAEGDLARRTLARMEALWNQAWDFGGYPLHTAESEPIVLGAWPMSLYVITQAAAEARQYDIVRRNIDFMLTTKEGRGYTWWEYRDAEPDKQIDYGFDVNFDYGDPVLLFVYHLLGYRPEVEALNIVPHLPPELEEVYARLRLGDHWVQLRFHNRGRYIARVEVNSRDWSGFQRDAVRLGIPEADLLVEMWMQETPPD